MNKVKETQTHICYYCGQLLTDDNFTIDHLIPLSRGGKHKMKNLKPCCMSCNREKGSMTRDEYLSVCKPILYSPVEIVDISILKVPQNFLKSGVKEHKVEKVIRFYNRNNMFDKPVTIKSKDNRIITNGYARYVAAIQLHIDKIPVIYQM